MVISGYLCIFAFEEKNNVELQEFSVLFSFFLSFKIKYVISFVLQ